MADEMDVERVRRVVSDAPGGGPMKACQHCGSPMCHQGCDALRFDIERVRRLLAEAAPDELDAWGWGEARLKAAARDVARFALDQHKRAEAAERERDLTAAQAAEKPGLVRRIVDLEAERDAAEERAQRAEEQRDAIVAAIGEPILAAMVREGVTVLDGHIEHALETWAGERVERLTLRAQRAEAEAARLRETLRDLCSSVGGYLHAVQYGGADDFALGEDLRAARAALDAQPSAPAVPATCGDCKHARRKMSLSPSLVLCGHEAAPIVMSCGTDQPPPEACPLRREGER